MELFKILTLNSLQCSLFAAILFLYPLQKKTHFLYRAIGSMILAALSEPLWNRLHVFTLQMLLRHAENGTSVLLLFQIFLRSLVELSVTLGIVSTIFLFCCEIKLRSALCHAIYAYVTQNIAYSLFIVIMPYASHRGYKAIQIRFLWVELLVMLVVFGIVFFTFARKLPKGDGMQEKRTLSLLMFFLIMLLSRMLSTSVNLFCGEQRGQVYRYLLTYDFLLFSTLLITQILRQREERYRRDAELERNLRLVQQKQYESFCANTEAVRHSCHDMKHWIAALQREESSQRKEQILNRLHEEVTLYDTHMDTGNSVLDGILSDAWVNCHQKGIQWTCMADGTAIDFIDPVDLYILLGNALENAVENTQLIQEKEKRFLSVHIRKNHNMAVLRIENTCENEPKFENGIPLTTKENAAAHGFGVQSIYDVVSQYHGECHMEWENGIFTLSILFLKQE